MPRKQNSQWDFGDLFARPAARTPPREETPPPPPPVSSPIGADPDPVLGARKVLTVSELTAGIRRELEEAFGTVTVGGEISNFRLQPSGHAYFVLKDARCQVSCVRFGRKGAAVPEVLRDGVHVVICGEVTVYEPRGQYQLRVLSVELEGVGALQAAFERLKTRLAGEGLFDPDRKRPIPRFPRRVGLVTSPAGAAIRDVLHVVTRRYAGLELMLVPVRVQGDGAASEIAQAIARLNEFSLTVAPLDVVLLTRGGGSIEDLWAFNEEIVARAIVASAIPVISAVGHEVDFTIADFVADLRAATPSAAAEILTAAYVDSRTRVAEGGRRLRWLARRHLDEWIEAVAGCSRRLLRRHPRRELSDRTQRLDESWEALRRMTRRLFFDRRRRLETVRQRLLAVRPSAVLARRQKDLSEWQRRLAAAPRGRLEPLRSRLDRLASGLRLLSPERVLERGYSITFAAETGRVVRAASAVSAGDRLRTRLRDGTVDSTVASSAVGRAE